MFRSSIIGKKKKLEAAEAANTEADKSVEVKQGTKIQPNKIKISIITPFINYEQLID